ncbi:hypothetical protein BAE44_0024278 [Dichanthelium oligosanthes]|uniref:DUF659 domain-containing protein n=1 Tax=Dichanthelium oligosanthes TaxID=888268 RepID=A0A1E5UPA6_9POAL|nr:hypothetical protein BAE44_0024278 [Dichanthelium oligosanthes]
MVLGFNGAPPLLLLDVAATWERHLGAPPGPLILAAPGNLLTFDQDSNLLIFIGFHRTGVRHLSFITTWRPTFRLVLPNADAQHRNLTYGLVEEWRCILMHHDGGFGLHGHPQPRLRVEHALAQPSGMFGGLRHLRRLASRSRSFLSFPPWFYLLPIAELGVDGLLRFYLLPIAELGVDGLLRFYLLPIAELGVDGLLRFYLLPIVELGVNGLLRFPLLAAAAISLDGSQLHLLPAAALDINRLPWLLLLADAAISLEVPQLPLPPTVAIGLNGPWLLVLPAAALSIDGLPRFPPLPHAVLNLGAPPRPLIPTAPGNGVFLAFDSNALDDEALRQLEEGLRIEDENVLPRLLEQSKEGSSNARHVESPVPSKDSWTNWVLPSFDAARTTMFSTEKENINELTKPCRISWTTTRLSLVSDGWTDITKKPLINFVAASPSGPLFLKAIDTSREVKNKDYMARLFMDMIVEVGHRNVVQIITDNVSVCRAADMLVEAPYPKLNEVRREYGQFATCEGYFGQLHMKQGSFISSPQTWWANHGSHVPRLAKLADRSKCGEGAESGSAAEPTY